MWAELDEKESGIKPLQRNVLCQLAYFTGAMNSTLDLVDNDPGLAIELSKKGFRPERRQELRELIRELAMCYMLDR